MSRALLVASTGGHLDQLRIMVDVLKLQDREHVWVTARTEQSESLLADEAVEWVPQVASREFGKALRALPGAMKLHRRIASDLVVSTGAALATPHLVAARLSGCDTWYVESATRRNGPSLTGRLAIAMSGVRTMAQGFEAPGWEAVDDVFTNFHVEASEVSVSPDNVLVTLGTEQFPFHRAVDAIRRCTDEMAVLWQLGNTPADVPGARKWVPGLQLRQEVANADVVVCHAGVGSILMALSAGRVPVVLPRHAAREEHIDDHQLELAGELEERRLVIVADPDELTPGHLARAASLRVVSKAEQKAGSVSA